MCRTKLSGCSASSLLACVGVLALLLASLPARGASLAASAGPDSSTQKNRVLGADVVLDGTASSAGEHGVLAFDWFGPFGTASGATPAVYVPEGAYTIALLVNDGMTRSTLDTALAIAAPAFLINVRAKPGEVQIVWDHVAGTERYDVYRASEADPSAFAKIAETTSTYSTWLDKTVENEKTYLYAVGALSAGRTRFSVIASIHPTALRTRTPPNWAPCVYSTPIVHATAGIPYVYDVNGTDPNGNLCAYALAESPAGMAIDVHTGRITWTPSAAGSAVVRVNVTDGAGGSAAQRWTIAVGELPPLNRPPIAEAGGPYAGIAGAAVQFDGGASSDPDGDTLAYAWDFGDGATGDGPAPAHVYGAAGSYTVRLTVGDGRGGTAADEASATIMVGNRPPVIAPLPSQSVHEGMSLAFTVAASDPDGDAVTLTLAAHDLPGTPTLTAAAEPNAALFSWSAGFADAGAYSVRFEARDPGGLSASLSVAVTVLDVNRPPAIATDTLPDGTLDQPYAATIVATDPDGDALQFALTASPAGMSIDAAAGALSWRPAAADLGEHAVAVSVADGKGGTAARAYTLRVPDTITPSVFLAAPREAIPGAAFTAVAEAADNVGVVGLTIEAEGFPAEVYAGARGEHAFTLPPTLGIGATLTMRATARDAAGNEGRASAVVTVTGTPDTTPPAAAINAPAQVTPGTAVSVCATVSDAGGIAAVTFFVDGVPIGTVTGPHPSVEYQVPPDMPPEHRPVFSVEVADASGNTAAAQAETPATVVPTPDTTAPAAGVETPPEVVAGEALPVVAESADGESGVARVDVYVNHVLVATYQEVPAGPIAVPLPPGVTPGMDAVVEVVVTDHAGNATTAADIVHVALPARGVLAGEVFDAATGLPLAGARVRLGDAAEVITNARGKFSVATGVEPARLVVTRAGYTTGWRTGLAAPANAGREVFDVCLMPHASTSWSVSPVLGATLRTPFVLATAGLVPVLAARGIDAASLPRGAIECALPGGALADAAALTLTQVSPQALAGLLPGGWSPLGAFDLAPHGIAFQTPASATIPNALALGADAQCAFVVWDSDTAAWRVAGPIEIAPDGLTLRAQVAGTGQFAFVLADALPTPPPVPVAGEPLAGVPAEFLPDGVAASVSPAPRILFYSPGVFSEVAVSTAPGASCASGAPAVVRLDETYTYLLEEGRIVGTPVLRDLVLYAYRGTTLTAAFAAMPSFVFDTPVLGEGSIDVDLRAPAGSARELPALGPEGGTASAPDGGAVALEPGALTDLAPIELVDLRMDTLGLVLPADVEAIGGFYVSFGSAELARPATLSIPAPQNLEGRFVLVRPDEVEHTTRLVLVGGAELRDGRLVSSPRVGDATLEGARGEGRYLFVRVPAETAFVAGTVFDTQGTPLPGALVTSDGLGLVARSRSDGTYVACVRAAAVTLTALDLVRRDRGSASRPAPAPGAVVALDISLRETLFSVVSVTPPDGAGNVPLGSAIRAVFSGPLDPATVTSDNVMLAGPAGVVAGDIGTDSGGTLLTFRPSEALAPNASYAFALTAGVRDRAGRALAAPFASSFATLDTLPPPAPLAGALSVAIPDAAGRSRIAASQGTAGPHDTVTIVNKTRGTSVVVLVDADGSFRGSIDAGILDDVVIRIRDAAGNETEVALGRFKNPDGSVVVGPEGGALTAENDVVLVVPQGAFPQGAVVKVTALTEDDLGIPPFHDYPFVAGFELAASVKPEIYLDVSAPVPAGTPAEAHGIVARRIEAFGRPALSIVDTARVIDGRLETSSPPCPGIFSKFAQYAMFLNEDAQFALGVALLQMVPPARHAVAAPHIEKQPSFYDMWQPWGAFLPLVGSDLPGYTETLSPAYPFLNALWCPDCGWPPWLQGLDLWDIMAMAEVACMPIPADKSLVVVIRDADSGEVTQTIPLDGLAHGQTMDITDRFFTGGDAVPPVVVLASWAATPPYAFAAGKPLVLRFSEPVLLAGEHPVRLHNAAGGLPIYGSTIQRENNYVLVFSPETPLAAGAAYEVLLPGVKDLAGNFYVNPPAGPLTFTVFLPQVLSLLDKRQVAAGLGVAEAELGYGEFGFKDVDFATKPPGASASGAWETRLVAIREGAGRGLRIFTIDASDARALAVTGGGAADMLADHELDRLQLLADFAIVPRASQHANPQFWRDRELHYVVQDPSVRIVGLPDSPEVARWHANVCAPMAGYWSRIVYAPLPLDVPPRPGPVVFLDFDGTSADVRLALTGEIVGSRLYLVYLNEVRSFVVPALDRNPYAHLAAPLTWASMHLEGSPATWTPPGGYTGEITPATMADATSHVAVEDIAAAVTRGGAGDLAVVTLHRLKDSYLWAYDVTDQRNIRGVVFRLLCEDRDAAVSYSQTNWWAPAGIGYPRNFALVKDLDITHRRDIVPGNWEGGDAMTNAGTLGAYVAVGKIGLELVDIGLNFPPLNEQYERRYPENPGTRIEHYESLGRNTNVAFNDAVVAGGKVVAIQGFEGGLRSVEVYTPDLQGPICAPIFLQHTPVKLLRVDGFLPADLTGDDVPDPYDLILVLGKEGGMSVVLAPRGDRAPELVGYYTMPAGTFMWMHNSLAVDAERTLAYATASWSAPVPGQGLLVIDLSRFRQAAQDLDGDGWDDRIIARVPLIGTSEIPTGILMGMRLDAARGLLYAAMRGRASDGREVCLAVVKATPPSEEVDASLRSATTEIAGAEREFRSEDGETAVVFVDVQPSAGGTVEVQLDMDIPPGTRYAYRVREEPLSGDPADALLDLSGGNDRGELLVSNPSFALALAPRADLPVASRVVVDIFDAQGAFVRRVVLAIAPVRAAAENVELTTTIDRINGDVCGTAAPLVFTLSNEARVTIRIDGEIITQRTDGGELPIEDVLMPAGTNEVRVTRDMVPAPGEHPFQIRAVFRTDAPRIAMTAEGIVRHDIVINASLPVGHTFVKGIDVADGHLALMRQDLAVKGLGPSLEFTRTYSSAGTDASGPMGAGWSHIYDAHLVFDSCGRATLIGGEGSGIRFSNPRPDPDDPTMLLYAPQVGYHGRLRGRDGIAFEFGAKNGWRHRYELAPETGAEREYRLASIEDTFGNRLALGYDAQPPYLLRRVRDASGRTLEFEYDRFGAVPEDRIVALAGPMGLAVEFDYDEHGNLIRAARDVRVEAYAYSVQDARDRHNLVRVTDPNGGIAEYAYFGAQDAVAGIPAPYDWRTHAQALPPAHELVRAVNEGAGAAEEETTSFAYDFSDPARGVVTTLLDAWNVETVYTLNPRGGEREKRVRTEQGDNVTLTTWAYEEGIDDVYATRVVDPNGRVTRYGYDANGNLTLQDIDLTSIAGYEPVLLGAEAMAHVVTRHVYDPTFNKATRTIDAVGSIKETVLHPATGAELSVTTYSEPGRALTTTFAYRPDGLLAAAIDANGNLTEYLEYDEHGNATLVRDAAGVETTLVYDARSRLLAREDTTGRRTVTVYDELDNVTATTRQTGTDSPDEVVTHAYYPDGRRRTDADGGDHRVEYFYDTLGRLTRQVEHTRDGAGNEVAYEWTYALDPAARTTTATDPRGVRRIARLDALHRVVEVAVQGPHGPDQVVRRTEYDAVGNVRRETDITGAAISFALDGLYRVARTTLPVAGPTGSYAIAFGYDAAGNRVFQTDANGNRTEFAYDGAHRRITERDPLGNEARRQYDANGNIIEELRVANGLRVAFTYDGLDRVLTMTKSFDDPVSGQGVAYVTRIVYDDAAHTRTLTDPEGKVVLETFDGLDRVATRVADPGGLALTTRFAYDAKGNVASIADPAGRVVRQDHDGMSRLAARRYLPQGFEERFTYDGANLRTSHTDRRGILREFEYDNLGRPRAIVLHESITRPGQTLRYRELAYDDTAAGGPRVTTTDARGNRAVATYDALGREIAAADALGATLRSEYDGVNRTAVIDQRGNRAEFAYDALNRVTRMTNADGGTTEYRYFDAQNRKDAIDARGVGTREQYDALGRLRVTARSLAGAETYEITSERRYRGDGLLREAVDYRGNVKRFDYDATGRLTAETPAFGTAVQAGTAYTYDAAGRLLTLKNARDHGGLFDLAYAYDDAARTVTLADGEGNAVRATYDGDRNVVETRNARGHTETRRYDELGLLLAVTDALGGVTRCEYDAERNLLVRTDANGREARYAYDAADRLTEVRRMLDAATARVTRHGYDAAGNLSFTIDPKGQRTDLAYDALNRLSARVYTAHADPIVPYVLRVDMTYDAAHDLTAVRETRATDAAGATEARSTTFAYDNLQRLLRKTNADGKTLAYTYDANGNRLTLEDAAGDVTRSTYDALDRIETLTTNAGVTRYEYFGDGLLGRTRYPNGAGADYAYDRAGRVVQVRHVTTAAGPDGLRGTADDEELLLRRHAYAYDAGGNVLGQTVEGDEAWGATYAYDALDRLTNVDYGNGATMAYTYDAAGNRLTETGVDPADGTTPVARRYTYNALDELTRIEDLGDAADDVAMEYDLNGNLARRTANGATAEFTSNHIDRLVRAALAGGDVRFDYDYQGMRVAKASAAGETRYLYDGMSVVEEYGGGAGYPALRSYAYGAELASMRDAAGAAGDPARAQFFHADALGSVAVVTNADGGAQAAYRYDAWGRVIGRRGASGNTRTYTGHIEDPETGLVYYGARYYDPGTGRFTAQDPYAGTPATPASLHRYLYAYDNPLRYTDLLGYASVEFLPILKKHWRGVLEGIGRGLDAMAGETTAQIADAGVWLLKHGMSRSMREAFEADAELSRARSAIGRKLQDGVSVAQIIVESVEGTVKAPIDFAASLTDTSISPAQRGEMLVGAVGALSSWPGMLKTGLGLTKSTLAFGAQRVQDAQRLALTVRLLGRQRLGKALVQDISAGPAGRLGPARYVGIKGVLKPGDAWTIAGEAVRAGEMIVSGGLSEWKWPHLWRNLSARKRASLGHAKYDFKLHKAPGDIDIHFGGASLPKVMTDHAWAEKVNARLSSSMLDYSEGHGFMGTLVPAKVMGKGQAFYEPLMALIKRKNPEFIQEGLVRTEYMCKGIELTPGEIAMLGGSPDLAPGRYAVHWKGDAIVFRKPYEQVLLYRRSLDASLEWLDVLPSASEAPVTGLLPDMWPTSPPPDSDPTPESGQ